MEFVLGDICPGREVVNALVFHRGDLTVMTLKLI